MIKYKNQTVLNMIRNLLAYYIPHCNHKRTTCTYTCVCTCAGKMYYTYIHNKGYSKRYYTRGVASNSKLVRHNPSLAPSTFLWGGGGGRGEDGLVKNF